ncbi:hypothetical protein PHSY_006245 [Pseudozyma hubeiensis SY62]|uniref:Uncharacterized protein n=1 Tax=Pseudozyma hubeiensis (strain SY62) TaxID=1305764 RepID=R9PB96_PSEHS|nr:hypothetical protein PHSY_006245 [Pseudozyma hubeiensis SY62]GAC98651.1 hypothetical protein PHSY_006245 [Pseudozyma hubeiensis SY62]
MSGSVWPRAIFGGAVTIAIGYAIMKATTPTDQQFYDLTQTDPFFPLLNPRTLPHLPGHAAFRLLAFIGVLSTFNGQQRHGHCMPIRLSLSSSRRGVLPFFVDPPRSLSSDNRMLDIDNLFDPFLRYD